MEPPAASPAPAAAGPAAARPYRGRFAPSPTGPLHAGSLVAALASWLDARAHGGTWLVRIEDLDPPREVPGAAADILATLDAFGLRSDEPVWYQSARTAAYADALEQLRQRGLVYRCTCSRRQVELAAQAAGLPEGVYPGTCRGRAVDADDGSPFAWRLRVPDEPIAFDDRACGRCEQSLARDVGDFVLRRSDGLWAYQLAVVVDDAAQGVTDVVRGADLLDSTAVHLHLQRALGLPAPRYCHLPVIVDAMGQKLSKQTGARPIERSAAPAVAAAALERLGAKVPNELRGARPAELWRWAAEGGWTVEALRGVRRLSDPAC